ncbi:MAG: hypothetical protein NTY30_03935 [Candidatus Berkelbacteria bacterium]|nr:hypothetical protein [Candidatus Berkelbacteria bacterium]
MQKLIQEFLRVRDLPYRIPLSYEDIEHYQKIIVVLVETNLIMKEIDEVVVL